MTAYPTPGTSPWDEKLQAYIDEHLQALADAIATVPGGGDMLKSDNLEGLGSIQIAQQNLGLGDAAVKDVGQDPGTVAAGDDGRIVGSAQTSAALADMDSANARANIGVYSTDEVDDAIAAGGGDPAGTAAALVATEATSRAAADSTNAAAIASEATTRATADTTNASAIAAEASSRVSADTTLQTNITTEATARAAADTTNATAITTEATARAAADTTNATAISTETTRATTAEGAITSSVATKVAKSANLTDLADLDAAATNLFGSPVDISNLPWGIEHLPTDRVMAVQDGTPVAILPSDFYAPGISNVPSIVSSTLANGGSFSIADRDAGVFLEVQDVAGEQPKAIFGTFLDVGFLGLGPGGSTFPDANITWGATHQLNVANILGLTGATPVAGPTRWVGATTTGAAPTTGTWAQGDWAIDRVAGCLMVCTAGGTPGAWALTPATTAPTFLTSLFVNDGTPTDGKVGGSVSNVTFPWALLGAYANSSDALPVASVQAINGHAQMGLGPGGSVGLDFYFDRSGAAAATLTGTVTMTSPVINTGVSGSAIKQNLTSPASTTLPSTSAVSTALASYAPLASPTLTGTVTLPSNQNLTVDGSGNSVTITDASGSHGSINLIAWAPFGASQEINMFGAIGDTKATTRISSNTTGTGTWELGPGGSTNTDVRVTRTGTSAATVLGTLTIPSPVISGHATIEGVALTGKTGTGALVLATAPSLAAATLTGDLTMSTHNIVTDATTGTQFGTASTQKISFWGATPIVRGTAFTQTYSTSTHTHSNITATNPPAGGTGATAGAYDTAAHRDALIASVTALIVDMANVKSVLNAVVDDLQAVGLTA